MPRILLFDVNETLLDLSALDVHFQRVFGNVAVRRDWFAHVLRLALVATLLDDYHDFAAIGGAALEMVAARHNHALSTADRSLILGQMRDLPAYPDVSDSLQQLQDAGLRLAALTNSPPDVARAQLLNAGLGDFFEGTIFSVHPTRRFKPAPEPYHHAARELGVEPGELRLIAAHDWDVAGAMAAGCAAAFVARPGMVLNPLVPPPDIVGPDLRDVAEQILAKEPPPPS